MKAIRTMLFGFSVTILLAGLSVAQNQIYIAQNATGVNSGADCTNAHAASWFNTSTNWGSGTTQIGPGDTVHLCGTFTGSANSTILKFQGSGSSGSPITLFFEPGAIVQAPYCSAAAGGSSGGCISANGRSYVVMDGNGKTGTVRNSLNGASGASCPGGSCTQQHISTLIDLQNCKNCTVQNLNVGPTYIEVQNANSLNSTDAVAIAASGSNITIANNLIPNCGWCVNFFFNDGDSHFEAYGNSFNVFGHAFAVAGSGRCGPACSLIHDNHIGPAGTNWDASGCPNHKDGIHYFGGIVQDGTYVWNNWFGGDWGTCPTGFIFHDGSPQPNIKDNYTWNNVFQVVNTRFENTNGWVYGSNDGGGVMSMVNNTFIGNGVADNSLAYDLYVANGNLTFEGNVTTGIGDPIHTHYPTKTLIDYNVYNGLCSGGNCYVWNGGSYRGSFANWKTACSCDAHSVSTTSPGVNSDGTLTATSVARSLEPNLSGLAIGDLQSLAFDTTAGGTRSAVARPSSGSWDSGAYSYGAAVTTGPVAPSGLTAVVQ